MSSYLLALLFSAQIACSHTQNEKTNVIKFEKHTLFDLFVSEGAAVADINNDGLNDIVAGPYIFLAPNWEPTTFDTPVHYDTNAYSNTFLNFCMDINQDGWMDIIRVDRPGKQITWYENIHKTGGKWPERLIYKNAGNETPILADVDLDGRPDLIFNDPVKKQMIWASSPTTIGDTIWGIHIVSEEPSIGTHVYTHGLGFGDLDGDGHQDIIIKDGWWSGSSNPKQAHWKFNKATLTDECAQIHTLDVNGDGLQDILSSSAHNYGIWWHKQAKNEANRGWQKNTIHDSFSQSHALSLADIDGDGNPDLITGKRFFAHNGKDPGEFEPAVLYWFHFVPGENPVWTPHKIDNNSGVGLQVIAKDVDGDGLVDIVTSNKKGVHYFRQVKTGGKNN